LNCCRYGDLSPITPLGRALASLCAIFGISVVSMLVSVLAERYQRVYTRKLFLNEQYSDNLVFEDDENSDPSCLLSNDEHSLESQTSVTKNIEAIPHLDDNHSFTGISKEDESEEKKSSEKIQFVIGFISDEQTKSKESMMTEVIKELFQTKFGKQCLITRTDVVL
jgi:hypothetical protein